DPSHNATAPAASQNLNSIHWQTPVDLNPQYNGGTLLIHYGSPLITPRGTILVPVKTGAFGGFRVDGHHSGSGALVWSLATDYILAPHQWTPSCGPCLTPLDSVAIPGAGGTIYLRSRPDAAGGSVQHIAFFGIANYNANPGNYDANVVIDTPITCTAN